MSQLFATQLSDGRQQQKATQVTQDSVLKQKWNFCLHLIYTRVTASEIYKEPGQYHKRAHELGLQEQGLTGTVANRRTCLFCLKAAGYPSMWEGRPSIARPIRFARDVRNGSTLCWPNEACWMGWIWPEEWSCSWWQKWLPRSVGWT